MERTESNMWRWELVMARLQSELDALVDDRSDREGRADSAKAIVRLYCAMMARAQELEDFADDWTADDAYLRERLDAIRLTYPLPVPSGDEAAA